MKIQEILLRYIEQDYFKITEIDYDHCPGCGRIVEFHTITQEGCEHCSPSY